MTSFRFCAHFLVVVCLLLGGQAFAQENPQIGIANQAIKVGRSVTFNIYVENLGDVDLDTLSLPVDLDTVFGAGNYSIAEAPSFSDPGGTVTLNGSFDGSGTTELLSGGTLVVGDLMIITLGVSIDTPADIGSGVGVYSAQWTASGESPMDVMTSDLSDQGTDPDPNGNGDPTEAGEDDPTSIILSEVVRAGVALNVGLSVNQVTLTYYIENFGNTTLTSMTLDDDLDGLFGAGNYTLDSGPTLIDDPSTLSLNGSFDGSSDTALISSGTLASGDTASFRIVVTVNTIINSGSYSHQVSFTGQTSTDASYTDLSDAGTNPDANGDNDPADSDENDPTNFVLGEEPQIGVAHTVDISGSQASFNFYLENLGNVDLEGMLMNLDLDSVFGAGNYNVGAPTLINDPGTITLNSNFDGSEDLALIDTGSLVETDTAQILVVVDVWDLTDQGLGFGNFSSQVSVMAETANGSPTDDLSDDGTDPDPNGNGFPGDAGEDDSTDFSIAENPVIGVAHSVSVQGQLVASLNVNGAVGNHLNTKIVHLITIQNLGNVDLENLTFNYDLDAVYGNGNYGTVNSNAQPELVTNPGTININTAFNGSTNEVIFNAGSTLAAGQLAQIRFEVGLITPSDQGSGVGVYSAQVTVSGDSVFGGTPTSDLSDDGTNPDANENGDPTEAGEDDPTPILLGRVGIALNVTSAGNVVTFDYYLENFSQLSASNLAVDQTLDAVFGVGNYTLSSAPSLIDDPGTLTLNAGFDGSTDEALIDSGASTLASGDTAQIQLQVTVSNIRNIGLGLGNYSAQVYVYADLGGANAFDASDSGTDPDSGGDGDPTSAGDDQATTFTLTPDGYTGIALNASSGSNPITLDIYLEGFGIGSSLDLLVALDLDATFGAGNWSLNSAPAFIDDPGTINLNGSWDGSSDTSVLGAGSSLANGDTAQIQLVVNVDTESDPTGEGVGYYEANATVSSTDVNGISFTDESDFGTDPDPNGNSDPTDGSDLPSVNESDPTGFLTSPSVIGLAVSTSVIGTQVTYNFFIENLGNTRLTLSSNAANLFGVYGFGNYSMTSGPTWSSGVVLTLINTFDGTFQQTYMTGGTLDPGEKSQFSFTLDVTTVTDQGDGFGVYETTFTINAFDATGALVSDVSDSGIDPDPNGNGDPTEAGENDPTIATIGSEGIIGVALDAAVVGSDVTLGIYLENFTGSALNNVSVPLDLDAIFGAGNYTITGAPSGMGITQEPTYDGSIVTELIQAGESLGMNATASVHLTVQVDTVVDVGEGLGNYSAQVVAAGDYMSGTTYDTSDNGTDPDPDGNGLPSGPNEADPTEFNITQSEMGVALDVSTSGNDVTFDFYVENLGNGAISGIAFDLDLDAIFGAGNYSISSGPVYVSEVRSLDPNADYDGSTDTAILTSGTQAVGIREQIRLVVSLDTLVDNGSGYGVYSAQITATANGGLSDISDDGTDPDPNGSSFPGDAGEDDPSAFTVTQDPEIGVAVSAAISNRQVTLTYTVETFGNVEPQTITVAHDLDGSFGAGNYSINTGPTFTQDPGTVTLNAGFNGAGTTALLSGGSTLARGSVLAFTVIVDIDTVTDQGSGLGIYSTQATASSTSPDATIDTDTSDNGTDPDPDGDGVADEADENDATDVVLESQLGDFVWLDLDGDGVQDGGGEVGLVGVTVYLDTNSNGTIDLGEASTATDGSGAYSFQNLAAGTYTVAIDASTVTTGFVLTGGSAPASVTLFAGEIDANVDFGYQQQDATIGDYVWHDENADGVQDAGEAGISGVTVYIDANSNGSLDGGEVTAVTDGSGAYDFTDLPLGTYSIQLDATTFPVDYVAVTTVPLSPTIAAGEDYNDADFGLQLQDATIGDFVWNDLNGDGVQDAGEPGISGVTVYIDSNSNGSLDGGEPNGTSDGTGAYSITNLAPGTYSVRVDSTTIPVGFVLITGEPQSVTLTLSEDNTTTDFGLQQQDASIGDFVWNDLNGDGVQDAGEPGLSGYTVYMDDNSNGMLDAGEASLVTDGSGAYDFTDLPTGTYRIRVDESSVTAGFVQITAAFVDVNLAAGEDYNDADFGYQQQDAVIGDFVWNDLDGDGVQDGGEPGISGITVYLDSNSNGVLDAGEPSSTTDGSGAYSIGNLPLGTYAVTVDTSTVTAGFVLTGGSNPNSTTLTAGQVDNTVDFGYQQQDATIGDFVWHDENADGVQDAGEAGISGVTVYIDANSNGSLDGGETTAVTDGSGAYDFTDLPTGTYTIQIDASTFPTDYVAVTTVPLTPSIAAGEDYNDADFGLQLQNATIGDFVWNDLNGDNVQDAGEPGISGVTVFIDANSNGSLDGGEQTAVSDGSGAYSLTNLAPGTYSVALDATTIPAGFVAISSSPQSVTIVLSENNTSTDFGLQQQDATIGDFVWNDLNGDGVQDGGEPGLAGYTVYMDSNSNGSLDAGEPSAVTDGSGAYDFTDLPTGNYQIRVDESSVTAGFVQITAAFIDVALAAGEDYNNADFGYQQQDATIGDFVWDDINGDGVQDAGEPGVGGYVVYIDANSNGSLDAGESSQTTDANGAYDFTDLATGSYRIRIDETSVPASSVLITAAFVDVSLAAGEDYNDADFGYQIQDATIGDFVWDDQNGNGVQDAGEPGLAGIDLYLDLNSNGSLDAGEPTQTTDANGAYDFINLATGTYIVRVDETSLPLPEWVLTSAANNITVNLGTSEDYNDADFGYQLQNATIGDLVFEDRNRDGVAGSGEPRLSGVRVYLDLNTNGSLDAGEPEATTAVDGSYDIGNLAPGTYTVMVDTTTVPADYVLTTDNQPQIVTLTTSQDFNNADFGYQKRASSIAGLVWSDENGDGIRDAGEPGIPGVTVAITRILLGPGSRYRPLGDPEIVTTQADGSYILQNLSVAFYLVQVTDDADVLGEAALTTADAFYFVEVDQDEAETGKDFGYCAAPIITVQPEGGVFCVGDNVTLSVTAEGTGVLAYQWYFNGNLLGSETNPTLVVNNAPDDLAGTFTVEVSNNCGTVVSDPAEFEVKTLRVGLPSSVGHGIDNLVLEAELTCDTASIDWLWEDLSTGEIFGENENPATLPYHLYQDTVIRLTAQHPSGVEVSEEMLVLVASKSAVLDPNADGCNTIEDLWYQSGYWRSDDLMFDANDDGRVDMLDLLFVNTSNPCSGD